MKIDPFDEGLEHRRILPYDPAYREIFALLRAYIEATLTGVALVHIGSTAVVDLRGKPMLDIAAITSREDLRAEQLAFERLGFHRRAVWVDRDDKPYVCGSVAHQGRRFNVNLHVCHRNDPVHADSIAFVEVLERRPDLRRRYEEAKDRAHSIDPANPEIYNREKELVIREIQDQRDRRRSPSRHVLRKALTSDIADIQRVRQSVHENRLVSTVITDAQVREAIEKTGRGWVIETDGEVVAFAIGNAADGNIWALFVHPDHERRGYGGLLHDAMIDWLWSTGLQRLWLTTQPRTRAQGFYEAAAWRLVAVTDSGEVRFERYRAGIPTYE